MGTLYRHFPDCDHLVFAALNAQGEDLRAASAWICSSVADAEQFEWCLAEVEDYLGSYQGLPDSVAQARRRGRARTDATGRGSR